MADDTQTPQGEAFGNVDKFPKVQGRCPSCGRESLFLASGGYVTCSIIGCADPDAAHDALTPAPTPQTPDDVREAVARAIRNVGIGPLGPNTIEIAQRGGDIYMTPDEAMRCADAALSAIPKPMVSAEAIINAVSDSLGGSFSDSLTDHIAEDVVARLCAAGIEVES